MSLFMDVHKHVDGLTADGIAEAHKKDLNVQDEFGVKYLKYWFNADSGTAFCLFEAPSKEAGSEVHKKSHGLIADDITEVQEGM